MPRRSLPCLAELDAMTAAQIAWDTYREAGKLTPSEAAACRIRSMPRSEPGSNASRKRKRHRRRGSAGLRMFSMQRPASRALLTVALGAVALVVLALAWPWVDRFLFGGLYSLLALAAVFG